MARPSTAAPMAAAGSKEGPAMDERMEVPRLRPVEAACPTCGAVAWGLMAGGPDGLRAACYPKGHERPVERF